ncbi:hypothetical protein [Pseudofrankia sp. BMG5.37]|uniref:hypothetical protein n=1 Tax=Pseudofrankia sp. BMG5.37 TaxID=3050035 RepID=UPI0028955A08|nr:hypothetical protein [Pseudofrankia sp. BMG5.37]MDT3446834.1 hypothetical protein [Pseudofrankia sp. BMG5.37]
MSSPVASAMWLFEGGSVGVVPKFEPAGVLSTIARLELASGDRTGLLRWLVPVR